MPADLRSAYRELVEIAGRLIQEAKHHHVERGVDLSHPVVPNQWGMGLPVGLRQRLIELERATGAEVVAALMGTPASADRFELNPVALRLAQRTTHDYATCLAVVRHFDGNERRARAVLDAAAAGVVHPLSLLSAIALTTPAVTEKEAGR